MTARARVALFSLLLALLTASPAVARVIQISAGARVSGPRSEAGDGLLVRFKDVDENAGCSIAFCTTATDTVTRQVTVMPNINFLLNTGSVFGPWGFGGGFFETRWDAWINIKSPGDYRFAMQVDDGASITIGDSLILALDGGHWFESVVSDTVRFAEPGLYPLRAYYFDCPFCCRGFRFGGMGPAGSGLMAWTPGFDFNADLGPCCTFGGNGPGNSVVPVELFFRTLSTASVEPGEPIVRPGAILASHVTPNPARAAVLLTADLGVEQRIWVDVFDGMGRRVATLANGERYASGTARWAWSPAWGGASGSWFYRVRAEDGSEAAGRIVIVR